VYSLLKPLLFRLEPERVHDLVMGGLEVAGRVSPLLALLGAMYRVQDRRLETECFGLRFPNPVGLAAGMDKNARAVAAWPALGFGFVELGSMTAQAQPGNPKPRLFRLPADGAIINRMGFNNDGAEAVAARLRQPRPAVPIGINLGKSKVTPLEEAPGDYLYSLKQLWPHGDYFVVNVSSPNTPGLRELQDRERLEELLSALMGFVAQQHHPKPMLLKIAPDLTWSQLDQIMELVLHYRLSGIIATNTTLSREGLHAPIEQAGGLSGGPLRERSREVLRHLLQQLKGRLPVVSVGGIFGAQDVIERLKLGASLVQVYTGFVYEGPGLLRQINWGLLEYLERSTAVDIQRLIGSSQP
jgi:dihydroorotate dehydrogenase